jgi:Hsp70 protein
VISPGDWVLAIDFGTTNTVAAMTDAGGTTTLMVDGRPVMPSAVFLNPDRKTWSVGDTAIRIARRRLEWFDANPKRGVPDGTLFLGGQSVPVGDAIAAVMRPIVTEAVRQHGGRKPAAFVVTHPANWGEGRVTTLVQAAAAATGRGWPRPQPLSEPVAAAQAILGMPDIPPQARLVVLDLGGGTVDATVVDRDGDVLTVAGQPQGRDGMGGEDYDQRLARWMVAEVGAEGLYDSLAASDDPDRRERAVEIRADARIIKEQLSRQSTVPGQLPKSPPELPEITPVLVSRPQLEALIRGGPGHEPGLADSVDVVSSVLDPVPPGPPFVGVFLTGGCSGIPMLGALVHERTGHPPRTYGDPTTAVAQGATQLAWKKLKEPEAVTVPGPVMAPGPAPTPAPDPSDSVAPPPGRPVRRLVLLLIALLAAGGLVTGVALAAANQHTSPPPPPPPATSSSAPPAASSSAPPPPPSSSAPPPPPSSSAPPPPPSSSAPPTPPPSSTLPSASP